MVGRVAQLSINERRLANEWFLCSYGTATPGGKASEMSMASLNFSASSNANGFSLLLSVETSYY
jgi:hypothetical protein